MMSSDGMGGDIWGHKLSVHRNHLYQPFYWDDSDQESSAYILIFNLYHN